MPAPAVHSASSIGLALIPHRCPLNLDIRIPIASCYSFSAENQPCGRIRSNCSFHSSFLEAARSQQASPSGSSCRLRAHWSWGDGGVPRGFSDSAYRFNLEEYMVTLDRPLGIRFAWTDAGLIIVESLMKHGNAERSRLVMVGDVLRKASMVAGEPLWEVHGNIHQVLAAVAEGCGPMTLVFERATHAPHTKKIVSAHPTATSNSGRVGSAAWHHPSDRPWNRRVEPVRGGAGAVGCATFLERSAVDISFEAEQRQEERLLLEDLRGADTVLEQRSSGSATAGVEGHRRNTHADVEEKILLASGREQGSARGTCPSNTNTSSETLDEGTNDPDGGILRAALRSLGVGKSLFESSHRPPSPGPSVAASTPPSIGLSEQWQTETIDPELCRPPVWEDSPVDDMAWGTVAPGGPDGSLVGTQQVCLQEAEAEEGEWQWPQEGFFEAAGQGSGTWWGLGVEKEDEFVEAYKRNAADLQFEQTPALEYTEITPQLVFGSGLRSPLDVCFLRQQMGITAVLDLQQPSDPLNWGLNPEAVSEAARICGMPLVRRPVRRFDGQDLRDKLPAAVAVLHRMLRTGHQVYLCSTEGLDRAPSVIVAYLHWVLAIPLRDAVAFIQDLKPCAINRAAITAATWDAIAVVDRTDGRTALLNSRPPTHSVQIVWNHGGKEVLVVGECCGGWNSPIAAQPAGGSRFILDLRLPMGAYRFKFIVDGHWRHAVDMPTEVDPFGNTNNLLRVGKLLGNSHANKGSARERVIERPLTDSERRLLTFSSQWMAFRISPRTFHPKKGLKLP